MLRIRIIHWKGAEAGPLIDACRECGFEVEYDDGALPSLAKVIRQTLPDALVIDLTRLPSQGREVALAIRRRKYSRHIPIVFVDGAPEKVEDVRRHLPDATFCTRAKLCSGIRAARRNPPLNPVVPAPVMERYASRTVAQKLGIKENSGVALFDPPRDYAALLGELPEGVELLEDPDSIEPVTLWFVRDPREYRAGLRRKAAISDRTKLWVVWRKGPATGLTDRVVREAANEAGLVDYKICSLGEQWSGMVFARRKS